ARWRHADPRGETEVEVAGGVVRHHVGVFAQRGADADLLRRPIDIDERVSRLRLDQASDPSRRADDEFGGGRLVAAGYRAESGQQHTVAAVASDLKFLQA